MTDLKRVTPFSKLNTQYETPAGVMLRIAPIICMFLLLFQGISPISARASTPDDEASTQFIPAPPILLGPDYGSITTGATHPPLGVPTLTWRAVAGAVGYQVEVSGSAGFANPLIEQITYATSYTPEFSLEDGEYFWRVKAGDGSNWGPYSEVRTFFKDWSNDGALVPRLLSPLHGARRLAFGHNDFSWTTVNGAAGYLFEISTDSSFSTVIYNEFTMKPHHTPTERLPNNTYYWRVTPYDNQVNYGDPSEPFTFIFEWDVAPRLLTPANNIDTPFAPEFTWIAIEAAKAYRLEIDTDADFPSPIACTCYSTDISVTSNLANDQEYYWRVKAIDDAGNSSPWSETFRFRMRWNFQAQLLTPPNNRIEQSYPYFSWTPIPGAERYQIQVDESTSFARPLTDVEVYNVTTFSIYEIEDTRIFIEHDYYWRVRGVDAQGNYTPWSDTYSFQLGLETSPNLIYPLYYYEPDLRNLPDARDLTVAWPLFIWDTAHKWVWDPEIATYPYTVAPDTYELTVASDPAFQNVKYHIETAGSGAAPTLSNPFTDLIDGTLYYWRVQAFRNGVQMGQNTTWLARFDTRLPQIPYTEQITLIHPPTAFEAVDVPPVLGWQPVTDAHHYRVQISRDAEFTNVVDEAEAQFVNYVPWQSQRDKMPFGTYWWRVLAEDANQNPRGDWSEARHFNLSVDLVNGNPTDLVIPAKPSSIAADTAGYPSTLTLIATDTDDGLNQYEVGDLHIMLGRPHDIFNGIGSYSWIFAFETASSIQETVRYGIYIDVDHQPGSGATTDPLDKTINVESRYLPEHVIYIERSGNSVDPDKVMLYNWTGRFWSPGESVTSIGGDAWYAISPGAVQVKVPYTSLASREDWPGSLAVTVFSSNMDEGSGILDSVPQQGATIDNPAFVSDMLMPLYPFDTPFSNPIIHYDVPPFRWRMPYFDSVDGYEVEVALDAKFTDVVDKWEIKESGTNPLFGWLPATFQSKFAYEDNESYYLRARMRNERYTSDQKDFDYGPWSPSVRIKLASRQVLNPKSSNDTSINMVPSFSWDRVDGAGGYAIQVDDDANFSNPEVNTKVDGTSYSSLAAIWDGTWYWRVAMRRADKVRGEWTPGMSFIKRSSAPVPVSPINAVVLNEQPTFKWAKVLTPTTTARVSAGSYVLELDDDPNFSNPIRYRTMATSFTLSPLESLKDGAWYWRVALVDAAGNIGTFSPVQQFYKEYLPLTLVGPTQGARFSSLPSFEWEPMDGAAYYEFEIANDPTYTRPTRRFTDNTRYTPVDSFSPSTLYWRVRMYDDDRHPGPYIEGRIGIGQQVGTLYLPLIANP